MCGHGYPANRCLIDQAKCLMCWIDFVSSGTIDASATLGEVRPVLCSRWCTGTPPGYTTTRPGGYGVAAIAWWAAERYDGRQLRCDVRRWTGGEQSAGLRPIRVVEVEVDGFSHRHVTMTQQCQRDGRVHTAYNLRRRDRFDRRKPSVATPDGGHHDPITQVDVGDGAVQLDGGPPAARRRPARPRRSSATAAGPTAPSGRLRSLTPAKP